MTHIKVQTVYGDAEVRAFPTAAPGLVVARVTGKDGCELWSVTHLRSGLALGFFGDPETAAHIAARLAPLADWTVDAATVQATIKGNAEVRALRHGIAHSTAVGAQMIDLNEVAR